MTRQPAHAELSSRSPAPTQATRRRLATRPGGCCGVTPQDGSTRALAPALVVLLVLLVAVAIAVALWWRPAANGPAAPGGGGDPADPRASASGDAPLPIIPVPMGKRWEDVDDPSRDGWRTEVLASKASALLEALAKALRAGAPPAAALVDLVDPSFSSGELWGGPFQTTFEDLTLRARVWRIGAPPAGAPSPAAAQDVEPPETAPSPAGRLARSLESLTRGFDAGASIECRFKVYEVAEEPRTVATRTRLVLSGPASGGLLERHAVWMARWTRAGDDALRLVGIEVEEREEVERRAPTPVLEDVTRSALGGEACYESQWLLGLNHWASRIQDTRFFALLGAPGLAAGDIDGDGLDDLYVCQEGGLPNRLLLQRPDGTLRDASRGSNVDWLDSSRSALILDLDNDGRADLAVAILGAVAVARGDGSGVFSLVEVLPTSQDNMSLSAADPDQDGDLDLYITCYKRDDVARNAGAISLGASDAFVYHDANNAAPNVFFENELHPSGALRFRDATAETGLDVNNRRYSFAAAWEDFDNDGDIDLYVANDFGRNNLYRNEGPTGGHARFVDVAAAANAEDSASGMSVSWGDHDLDGWQDLYVGNMFSSAGNRVMRQSAFKPEATAEVRERLLRFARGNTLLKNVDGLSFADVTLDAGVNLGLWAWSSLFADLNGDGLEDLVVANGYVTTDDKGDL